jgi:hypothetical protein
MHGTPCKYEAHENLILGLTVAAIFKFGHKKIPVVPVSYREKIKVGRSEIHFLKIFFSWFNNR